MSTQTSKGSFWGASLMLTGCSIGAGMLGLPLATASYGLIPSLFWMAFSCLFMMTTGLLLLEASLWFSGEVNLLSIAQKTLGNWAKYAAWALFLGLFYCLMVAYSSAGGELFALFFSVLGITVPLALASCICALVVAVFLYLGSSWVDWANRLLVVGLVLSYIFLVTFGIKLITVEHWKAETWSLSWLALPVMVISFGFHNLVPGLVSYLKKDAKILKSSIIFGASLPLLIYIIWQAVILGILPEHESAQTLASTDLVSDLLQGSSAKDKVALFIQMFSFFALFSSFITIALSCVDFLADGLQVRKTGLSRLGLILAVIFPPLICSLFYPHLFLSMLGIAGGGITVILFGWLPVMMVWKGRKNYSSKEAFKVPGGHPLLFVVFAIATVIFLIELSGHF